MKKRFRFICLVYTFFFIFGSAFAQGNSGGSFREERTFHLGGTASWRIAVNRTGVTEASGIRANSVLILCSAAGYSTGYSAATGVLGNQTAMQEPALDLYLSFNEINGAPVRDHTGRYRVTASPDFQTVGAQFTKYGYGAALFGGTAVDQIMTPVSSGFIRPSPLVIEPQSRNALFSSGSPIRDFSIEFWLYPLNLENGERIFNWSSTLTAARNNTFQQIHCFSSRNRLQWSFVNFFSSTNRNSFINIEFSGNTPLVPRTWSHHLIRFDATTGMVEYLVNGRSEAVVYATATGRENSEVFTPVAGGNGRFMLGEHYTGLMDEFKVHSVFAGRYSFDKFSPAGGRMETGAIDLGGINSTIVRVNASGGRTTPGVRTAGEFRENGRFRFQDDSEMNFFIRASDNQWLLNDRTWVSFTPGVNINEIVRGRYIQIAVDFYPSANGLSSPYLSEMRIVYSSGEPPMPPGNVTAVASDGAVMLSWRASPGDNTAGYLVYYSTVREDLFGTGAALGSSPIDAGTGTNILINGLRNGTLYYFRVAAYETSAGNSPGAGRFNAGEFSREVTARPLAGLPDSFLPLALEGR